MLLAITNHSLVSLSDLHGTRVLIKKARRTDEARVAQNWLNEIDILKRVAGGPHVALLLDSDPHSYTITLRYENGQPLDKCIDASQRCTLSQDDSGILLHHMSQALCFLHGKGIVHDDVKPDNIMWTGDQACLVDFGAAYDYNALGEDYFNPSGTPPYAPPEYLDRRKGPKGDIWALGVTMLFAKGLTTLPDGEWILPHTLEDGPPRREFEAWLSEVQRMRKKLEGELVAKLLEADPDKRISAVDLL